MDMIAIIDYDAGNVKSVEKALHYLGQDAVLTRDYEILLRADKVILPGVGNFGDAMMRLEEYGLVEVIHKIVEQGTPFLGICLGQQLIFDSSDEAPGVKGLGLLPGTYHKLPDSEKRKVPQIGWNDLKFPNAGDLFAGIPEHSYVYFVHSYYLDTPDPSIITATCEYGVTVGASVQKKNIYACQFHPEKSSEVGLQILRNFISMTGGTK